MAKLNDKNAAINEDSLNYFDGDALAATTWVNKYALYDEFNNILEHTPYDMHKRLAKELVRIENNYPNPVLTENLLMELFDHFKYVIPGGSSMSGIGNNYKYTSLSNCFVISSPEDSYGGIIHADEECIQVWKRRGGVGLDLSNLRPKNTKVTNDAKTSSGVVSFMERYSNSCKETAQNGRRGALMISISVNHPDVMDFIDSKLDGTKITGANISVRVTNDFMKAVKNKSTYLLRFPIYTPTNDLIDNFDKAFDKPILNKLYEGKKKGTYYKIVDAYKLWKKLIHNNWAKAEPGVLFWDKILSESPADFYKGFETKSTNPCFTGDTLLLTEDGYKTFSHLADLCNEGKCPKLINEYGESVTGSVFVTGFKHVIKVIFDNKDYIECTPNHKFKLIEGIECEAQYLLGKIVKGLDGNHSKVTELIDEGRIAEVYDFNLSTGGTHWGVVAGLIAHNCGELPLCPYDSCRLIALNLYSFVDNPFTDIAVFNFAKLADYTKYTQRIIDNIIDLELECINKIIKKVESDPEPTELKRVELELWNKILTTTSAGRRTGVGITAEGDMLAALGMQYGSDKAITFCEEVHKTIACSSYMESIDMAKDRGAFSVWSQSELYFDSENCSEFIKRIYNELPFDYQDKWLKYGRRNISNLTIAPTGTVSILTQTTSGIEPLFKAWYIRRRKTSDKSKAVFTDETGEMFEEFKVFHPKFIEWFNIKLNEGNDCIKSILNPRFIKSDIITPNSVKEILNKLTDSELQSLYELSPWYKSTAQDVDWVQKVKMQGTIQKWVDHSISCTVNLPSEVDEDLVNQIYLTAWQSGCKGLTIYRDGSRSGVLLTKESNKSDLINQPRPEVLPARVVRFKNGTENWIAFVGLLNNKPYECFCGKVDDDIKYLPKSIIEGEIHRIDIGPAVNGKVPHRYDFRYKIAYNYINTLPSISDVFNSEYFNYARLISGMLRGGIPVIQVVNILNGLNSDMGDTVNTWKKGVARALRQFVKDGEKSGDKCPKCGTLLIFQGGCQICPNCGESRCE